MEALKSAVKISLFAVLIAGVVLALQSFISLFIRVVIPDLAWELLKVIDCFLPFDGQVFFMILGRSITAIGVFLFAYRIYILKMDYTKHV